MDGSDLICNNRRCHKSLGASAWVTSCSHIFCDECANVEFSKSLACPACQEKLPTKYDLLRVDMQPEERYKSMVLAGLKPDVIMEISTRALSFWNYQICQKVSFLELSIDKAREKKSEVEQMYSQLSISAEADIARLKSQLAGSKHENETCKQKISELAEKLDEKARQHQRLQTLYDALRRQCISQNMKASDGSEGNRKNSFNGRVTEPFFNRTQDILNRGIGVQDENFMQQGSSLNLTSLRLRSPAQRDVGLREDAATPVQNGLQSSRYFRKPLPSPRNSARRKKLF